MGAGTIRREKKAGIRMTPPSARQVPKPKYVDHYCCRVAQPCAKHLVKQLALKWWNNNCGHTVQDDTFKQECVGGCLVALMTDALTTFAAQQVEQARRETWEECWGYITEAMRTSPADLQYFISTLEKLYAGRRAAQEEA